MNSVLKVEDVCKAFGSRKAVDHVSFELPAGAFLSVFGPNGAGKTTLLRMIATLSRPTSGKIIVNCEDANEKPDQVRESIGFISHDSLLYGDLTAEENLVLYGKLYGVDDPVQNAIKLLDAVGLKHRRKDSVKTFSRGMTQRVSIARALINDPQLVLLDEPYAGLDPRGTKVLDDLIESIREDRTFVMVSHDLKNGFDMCTYTLILSKGRVVTFSEKDVLAKTADDFATLYHTSIDAGVK